MSGYGALGKNFCIVVIVATLALLAPPVVRAADQPEFKVAWTDEFRGPDIDKRWTWAREDPTHWSLKAHPGQLRIVTQTGGIYGDTKKQKNILLTPTPSGDFRIVTKCTIDPRENFQYAGLMVYQGRGNYAQINRAYTDGNSVNFDIEVDGNPINKRVKVSDTTIFLRITRLGTTYIGEYSTDGETWTEVGRGTANLTETRMGICAANNLPKKPHIPADFDFVTLSLPK